MLFADLRIGQRAEIRRIVTLEDIEAFADLTGDRNPVHLDEAYAATTRFGGRVAHGMLFASFISAVLGMELPGPGVIYLGQSLRFRMPVRPGDELTVAAEVSELVPERRRVRMATSVVNQHGETVLDGDAELLLPA